MLIRRLLSFSLTSIDIRAISICVIGSGPAGFYCTQNLLKLLPESTTIDIYDKIPVPFGLVRFGVVPDHPEVKNVVNTFNKIGSNPRVKFVGNVTLGRDIFLEDLKTAYNAVVLSYGADQDIEFGIHGESLSNVVPARKFVGWYNGLPDNVDLDIDLNSEVVAIFGQGNVAVDVARILLKSVDELKNTDITEHALSKLAESKVRTVFLIGRRGPLQVAFTIKEFREMLKLPNVHTIIDKTCLKDLKTVVSDLPRPRKRLTELLLKTAEECKVQTVKNRQLNVTFLRSPLKFDGNDAVCGVELNVNKFKNGIDQSPEFQKIEPTGKTEYLTCGLAFRSIGYKSSPAEQSIPFKLKNCIGDARVMTGVYSAGWLNTGPTGVILSTMTDAFNTANLIFEDLKAGHLSADGKPGFGFISRLLMEKGIITVDWNGWKKIDDYEIKTGKELGKPREKIVSVDKMLEIGGILL